MGRSWKTWDLVDLFNSFAKGYLPIHVPDNSDNMDRFTTLQFPMQIQECYNETEGEMKQRRARANHQRRKERMSYTIEKGVAMTPRKRTKPMEFPLEIMEVGDSFLVQCEITKSRPHPMQFRLAAAFAIMKRRYPNRRFATRRVQGGVRVWRTQDKDTPACEMCGLAKTGPERRFCDDTCEAAHRAGRTREQQIQWELGNGAIAQALTDLQSSITTTP